MNPHVTVIIPTHAPNRVRLERVLSALARQDFENDAWELLIVDNASPTPVPLGVARIGHPRARVVQEPSLGLSNVRVRGIAESRADILVFVDDDNVLDPSYLTEAVSFFERHPTVAALGGQIVGEYETRPPAWAISHLPSLAIRELGANELISDTTDADTIDYPYFAPVGAGLSVRRPSALRYSKHVSVHGTPISDRRGTNLLSAGDCELVQHAALLAGQAVAYSPRLRLTHLIPASRLRFTYLARLNYSGGVCWTQFQRRYGFTKRISGLTVPARSARAFVRARGWTQAGFIHWCSITGQFVGRAFD